MAGRQAGRQEEDGGLALSGAERFPFGANFTRKENFHSTLPLFKCLLRPYLEVKERQLHFSFPKMTGLDVSGLCRDVDAFGLNSNNRIVKYDSVVKPPERS